MGTEDEGKFQSISLGQGQEPIAEKAMDRMYVEGGWVMLENIELVAKWLPKLEKKLEALGVGAHPDFRVFMSAQPQKVVPVPILQRSIKVTNEPPSGLKANMLRGFLLFNGSVWENSSKQSELKAIVFALVFFHSIMCERRKFGPIGWNRNYPYANGDLTVCITVANNYVEQGSKIPWDDMRYLFGEIMYGGHITDNWDRRLCNTYLLTHVRAELVEGIDFFPSFPSPPAMSYKQYQEYIEETLEKETPIAYGLHPNSEINFMTTQSNNMFNAIGSLQPRGAGGGGAKDKVKNILNEIMEKIPEQFSMLDVEEKIDERTPYTGVFLQECDRMNALLFEMKRSLIELDMGLKGELSITDAMEAVSNSLFDDSLPPTWVKNSWDTMRPLSSWLVNMLERYKQLSEWTADLQTPKVTWLSGLFNPQAFLTAVLQVTARKNEWALDKMAIQTDVTKKAPEEVEGATRDGAYVHGLYCEGARWDMGGNSLDDAKLKELYPIMPVILVKAQTQEKMSDRDIYSCPCYKTQFRGPTFVFAATLRTKLPAAKWVMAGVALLMDVVE